MSSIRIKTSFVHPPIPIRSFDWQAWDDNTYDCDCDEDGFFSNCPLGHGATEQEAIDDLLQQIEERQ